MGDKMSADMETRMSQSTLTNKILWFLACISILNGVSLVVLEAWWMAALSFTLSGLFVNSSRTVPTRYLKKPAIFMCLVAMLIVAPATLNQLTIGIRHIGDHALKNKPESLNRITRFGLWWSAVWLSIGGIAYWTPYTVAEQVLMFWPGPKNRVWNDNFPSKAKKVRHFINQAQMAAGTNNATYKYDLIWRSYCEDNCDVGLALNGGDLSVEISNNGQSCLATARVSVSYKSQYRSSTILGYGSYRLRIDQAAYWALQELGWLFPFTLRYRWEC
jgi:hypothetical protein